ncbi:lysophospholipid acyltransferase family protein [Williamsia sterculiae]|uniref:1-acyl-sn-glycerol-3-phosphate acyltransferase n=1 Tax=Williamsia sterculiae TaxID=1344003 RepID=A0A1N7CVZ7_9NOCA|nr:lysophospholipid acyltransferase family protein [Williamsia sterculiae]SIR67828.1 1-acyl-sn-glycerol-3-phosphate acyltransferase [Williamsia sterculiae]
MIQLYATPADPASRDQGRSRHPSQHADPTGASPGPHRGGSGRNRPRPPTLTRPIPDPQLRHPNTDDFEEAAVHPISEDVRLRIESQTERYSAGSPLFSLGGVRETIADSVVGAAAFLRERLTGDYHIDDFGFDQHFTESVWLPTLRVLFEKWFRVEVTGVENIPAEAGALLVGNHAGTVPVDALMTTVAVHDHHPAHRHLRVLAADLAFETPFIGELARSTGSTLACTADAERLLRSGELTAVWPEGFKGVGKLYRDRYKLQRFGRGGFVTTALRAGVPIVPVSIVGSEEIYPMISDLKPLAKVLGLPYLPITPTFPWLGPLGLVPLPSKWHIHFGKPIETSRYDEQAAEDPMVVFDLTDQVREDIQQTLYRMLSRRDSIYFG